MNSWQSSRPSGNLSVGAHAVDVTPRRPMFLYGYPHVPRISTGIGDPLMASAMYVDDGQRAVVFVNLDVIWVSKPFVAAARERIQAAIGLAPKDVVITATHTHSGPVTLEMVSNADDPVIPPPDLAYLEQLLEGAITAAAEAYRRAEPAEMTFVTAECAGIGGNRHDPCGVTIEEIPIVAARSANEPARWLALMYVNRVHPTVLHEDSTLVSGDFPGTCRQYLQSELLGHECPVLCHLGAAGNQSPRNVTRVNDYAETRRLGELLGNAIQGSLAAAEFRGDWTVAAESSTTNLPMRRVPALSEASELLVSLNKRLDDLRATGAERSCVRTAECSVFGAEETVCLARAATRGELQAVAAACLPAEVQIVWLDKFCLVAWPGEVFSEFALRVRAWDANAYVITLANGELQGYLVTEEAVRQNAYEASNAIFASPESGETLVRETIALFARSGESWHTLPALMWSSVNS